jgi:hypothetical protein
MSQIVAPVILNLDPPAVWDNFCPVLLPLGPPTLSSIIPASMGLFVPVFVFVTALFMHLYGIWSRENSSLADNNNNNNANEEAAYERRFIAPTARSGSRFFKGPPSRR